MSLAAPPELAETGGATGTVPLVLERRYWLLAAIPLGVLVLVYLVLCATRPEGVGFAIITAEQFASVAASEARYRSFWVAAFLLSAAASAAVALSVALGLWRLPLARDRNAIAAVILAVIALLSLNETVGSGDADRWYVAMGVAAPPPAGEMAAENASDAPLLYRALFAAPPAGADMQPVLQLLDHGLDAIKILGIIALTLTGAGLVLTLARPRDPLPIDREAARLADALARQQALLQQATIVFVAALVAMLAWMHWPLPFLADDATREAYRELLVGNALLQGVGYSLGLASLYLPPALLLQRRIADLADTSTTAKQAWLKEQGLEARPFEQLRQLATLLLPDAAGAPAVAGEIVELKRQGAGGSDFPRAPRFFTERCLVRAEGVEPPTPAV